MPFRLQSFNYFLVMEVYRKGVLFENYQCNMMYFLPLAMGNYAICLDGSSMTNPEFTLPTKSYMVCKCNRCSVHQMCRLNVLIRILIIITGKSEMCVNCDRDFFYRIPIFFFGLTLVKNLTLTNYCIALRIVFNITNSV